MKWLVDDWRQALQWSSVRLHIVAVAIGVLYETMPALDPSIAGMLPCKLQAQAIGLYALIGLGLRLSKLKSDA